MSIALRYIVVAHGFHGGLKHSVAKSMQETFWETDVHIALDHPTDPRYSLVAVLPVTFCLFTLKVREHACKLLLEVAC